MTESREKQAGKTTSARYYRPELDWLRFTAFSAVFVYNSFPTQKESYTSLGVPQILADFIVPLVQAGTYGVDLFFALSAFLITELLLLERERTGKVHIQSFYVRRILRIWPLYFVFLLIACPLETLYYDDYSSYYALLFVFLGNWYRTFSDHNVFSVCIPLWSVCIEEQFYLVWPNLVARTKPARFGMLMAALLVLTCMYRVLHIYALSTIPDSVWTNTLARMDPFALGGLLALLLHARDLVLSRIFRGSVWLVGLGMFWFLGTFPFSAKFFTAPLWSYPIAAVASVLCILALVSAPQRLAFPLPLRALSYLGKISYGLYVFHFPAILLSHTILPEVAQDKWLWVHRITLAAVTTLVAAMISYECLEKPFLKLKRRFSYVESRPE